MILESKHKVCGKWGERQASDAVCSRISWMLVLVEASAEGILWYILVSVFQAHSKSHFAIWFPGQFLMEFVLLYYQWMVSSTQQQTSFYSYSKESLKFTLYAIMCIIIQNRIYMTMLMWIHFRVVAIDLPGYGGSDKPEGQEPYLADNLVRYLSEVITELGKYDLAKCQHEPLQLRWQNVTVRINPQSLLPCSIVDNFNF